MAASEWGSATWPATSPTSAPAPPRPFSPWHIRLLHPSALSPLWCFQGKASSFTVCKSVHSFAQGVRQLPFQSRYLLRLDDLPGAPTTLARLMEAGEQLLPPRTQRSRGDRETACSRLLCHVEGHPAKRRDGAANRRGCLSTVQAKIHPAAHPGPQQHPCNLKAVHTAHLFSSSVHTTQTSPLTLQVLLFRAVESRGDQEKDLLSPTSSSDLKPSLIGTSKVFCAATKSRGSRRDSGV